MNVASHFNGRTDRVPRRWRSGMLGFALIPSPAGLGSRLASGPYGPASFDPERIGLPLSLSAAPTAANSSCPAHTHTATTSASSTGGFRVESTDRDILPCPSHDLGITSSHTDSPVLGTHWTQIDRVPEGTGERCVRSISAVPCGTAFILLIPTQDVLGYFSRRPFGTAACSRRGIQPHCRWSSVNAFRCRPN
jgi:hypothetical protein